MLHSEHILTWFRKVSFRKAGSREEFLLLFLENDWLKALRETWVFCLCKKKMATEIRLLTNLSDGISRVQEVLNNKGFLRIIPHG